VGCNVQQQVENASGKGGINSTNARTSFPHSCYSASLIPSARLTQNSASRKIRNSASTMPRASLDGRLFSCRFQLTGSTASHIVAFGNPHGALRVRDTVARRLSDRPTGWLRRHLLRSIDAGSYACGTVDKAPSNYQPATATDAAAAVRAATPSGTVRRCGRPALLFRLALRGHQLVR